MRSLLHPRTRIELALAAKRLDFDIGWRRGLNGVTDDALLAGVTARW
jgi:hypothetical protein